ncbi:MAG: hypothetical protein CVT97_06675, partial [Bacteroidetes bacterium HGW-Bacteroidetes-14]
MNSKPIPKGYLCIDESGTITEIGQLKEESESTEFYNGIIVPGFVNSHCHIELSHLVNCFEQDSGMAGFIRQINRLRNSVDEDGRKQATEEQMNQLYKSGVSAMADISNCSESFAIKAKSPLYTRTFLEVFGSEPQDAPKVIAGVKDLHQVSKEAGIDAAPTPHSCYTMSRDLLRDASAAGLEEGFISYHNQESWEEEELVKTGTGPLAEEYRSRGLSTPPVTGGSALRYFISTLRKIEKHREGKIPGQILLVHNTFTNKESIDSALAELENPYWAICPMSNLFIHRALPPLELMRSNNLKICLGTDSLSSNTVLSMVDEML